MLTFRFRIAKLRAECCCSFSCHTNHGKAVRSVRRNFKVDNRILKLHRLRKISSQRIFFFKNPDPVSLIYRHNLILEAKFAEGTKHTV